MNRCILSFIVPLLMSVTPALAKGGHGGHGGGHGGHGGGSHGGGGHSSGHSGGGMAGHSSAGHMGGGTRSAGRSSGGSFTHSVTRSRVLPGGYNARPRTFFAPTTKRPVIYGHSGGGYTYHDHWRPDPYYYYGYPPFLYDPYLNVFSLGMNFVYSPSYCSTPVNYNTNNTSTNHPGEDDLDGFVVFEHDTIPGAITIRNSSISLETADTARGYDYKFRIRKQGLDYVTVYNDDDKQLNLVRLKEYPKKLLRVVHPGKLTIYDEHHDFIYSPEDIDAGTIKVVYNGELIPIHAHSLQMTKQRLTEYVNKAYGTNLDPKNFTWNSLLIYIDKLD